MVNINLGLGYNCLSLVVVVRTVFYLSGIIFSAIVVGSTVPIIG